MHLIWFDTNANEVFSFFQRCSNVFLLFFLLIPSYCPCNYMFLSSIIQARICNGIPLVGISSLL